MTKRQRESVARYVGRLLPSLGLSDWEVVISGDQPDDEEWLASCKPAPGRKFAVIRVRNDFATDPPEQQRETLVHELLHCAFAAPQHQVEFFLPQLMEDETAHAFNLTFFQAHEYAIDGLACAISRFFPLPSIPR